MPEVGPKRRSGPKRSKVQREHDLGEVARLYLRGQKQWEIGAALGITQQQVSHDLGILQGRWQESMLRDTDAHKVEQLRKLDEIEAEAWAAWERSKRPLEHSIDETIDDEINMPSGTRHGRVKQPRKRTRHATRTEAGHGDVAFLQIVLRCVEQRSRILGLLAPTHLSVSGQLSFGDLFALANGDGPPPLHLLPAPDPEA